MTAMGARIRARDAPARRLNSADSGPSREQHRGAGIGAPRQFLRVPIRTQRAEAARARPALAHFLNRALGSARSGRPAASLEPLTDGSVATRILPDVRICDQSEWQKELSQPGLAARPA